METQGLGAGSGNRSASTGLREDLTHREKSIVSLWIAKDGGTERSSQRTFVISSEGGDLLGTLPSSSWELYGGNLKAHVGLFQQGLFPEDSSLEHSGLPSHCAFSLAPLQSTRL